MIRPDLCSLSRIFPVVALFLSSAELYAQNPPPPKAPHVCVSAISPQPRDVATLDGIMKAFYEVITGPAGQPRQWARDRTLYLRGVRFVATVVGKNGKPYHKVMSHQEFVDSYDAEMVSKGFYEREIHRTTTTYGTITHVLSTYETRETPDGPLVVRGINSIELFNDGERWWISAVLWDEERQGNPIPKEFLP